MNKHQRPMPDVWRIIFTEDTEDKPENSPESLVL
jgi:hypothetical protein